jgi:hypothetical protein
VLTFGVAFDSVPLLLLPPPSPPSQIDFAVSFVVAILSFVSIDIVEIGVTLCDSNTTGGTGTANTAIIFKSRRFKFGRYSWYVGVRKWLAAAAVVGNDEDDCTNRTAKTGL